MKITKITVHAGGSFNDSFEQFANHKPGVSLEAEVSDGDDIEKSI